MTTKRYFTALNILLIAGAVYFGVKAFYIVSTARVDYVYPSKAIIKLAVSLKDSAQHPLSYYGSIIERNLFNTKTGTDRKAEKLDIESLKPTDLKLKLVGTVTGDKKDAYAVIVGASGKIQNLYRTGDTIQNATLKMILREKVVLHINGKDEVLSIEKARSSQRASRTDKRPGTKTSQYTAAQNITIKRSKIDAAVKDINNLMKQVRIRPHFTNGQPDGLRLTGIRPNSIFYSMGLKSGDVMKSVNGKDIVSVDDALKLYQNLQSSSNLELQVKRKGRLKTLNYSIE